MPLDLKGKVGPLPVWGWGVAIVGVAGGYFWWRSRSSGSATDTSGNATDSSGMDSTGYQADTNGIGYDSSSYGAGYAAGVNSNGSQAPLPGPVPANGGQTGTTNPPSAHNRFCAKTKDPGGKMVMACGYGTWVKTRTGWRWQPGAPPTAGPTSGNGSSGRITLPRGSAPVRRPPTLQPLAAGGISGTPSDVSGANPTYAAA